MIQMGSNERQVMDLVRDVEEGRLLPKPPFQRRAVWTPSVKDHFLETVLLGLPFPEIFIVTGKMDAQSRTRVDYLVDGQQRVSTLREYLNGSDDISYKVTKPYAELTPAQQKRFLSYPVTVRDLRQVDEKTVADIFARINSTDYALKATERFNALFTGAYRTFCEKLAEHSFFRRHRTFSYTDWKRMGDLTFTLILVTTLLAGYFRREEELANYLSQFNDEFPEEEKVQRQLNAALEFVDACNFPPKSRVWKKTDLFTLLVESCFVISKGEDTLDAATVGPRLLTFYNQVSELYNADPEGEGKVEVDPDVLRYMKAATKATNDKYARVEVIGPMLIATPASETGRKPARPTRKRRSGNSGGGKKR